ncbi:carboxylating nicotinate-nucleotide diphosphorylase [Saccharibacter sp. 17.LH.SD]|uniref:carboxylating nicotinate-nucleotide diphosphorylase n=1 Tax=Saccharibacter sp. 17.LH.SD TaxID=2689393 RepID=UPI00136F28FE|nr:carboxylating nicotinate-nucleotide diphosphorylase [Saccharibacter sp. 17.LH.SD]MXV44759.1 carboxylating nicotinate-nucleotide diphosphorylase [Saccharibacter sp. 17.LH.SD]
MHSTLFLPDLLWEPVVTTALREDFGTGGDVTTQALLGQATTLQASFRARQHGVVAGLPGARLTFEKLDPSLHFHAYKHDGDTIAPGDILATVKGDAAALLGGERVALNILSHLSGIATTTATIVNRVKGTGVQICCTRKTLPGLRALQKYAVRAGGGSNHRHRLDDAIMLKDNHIALLGGNLTDALKAARQRAGHLMKIELEVDSLEQLETALSAGGADAYLLDNMDPETLRRAVKMINGRAITEASGGITPDNARSKAETGVDVLSLGWLTHSVTALDIGLDIIAG